MKLGKLSKKILMTSLILSSIALVGCTTNNSTNGEKIDYVSVGDRKEPNLEELSSMDLDLIIADTSRHSEIYEDLNKIAPTIVLDSIDSSYDEYIENFETIAEIVGKEDVAKAKIEEAEKVLSDVKDKAKDKVSDEKV